jgi:hypothetical protein
MRTGKDILAAGVFTPSRSSNFEVEQRRAQVTVPGNDIRLDAHDMVLMTWRDGAIAPSF